MRRLSFVIGLLIVAALVIWRGTHRNLPAGGGDGREHLTFHRGHMPVDSAAANLDIPTTGATYPPRALGLTAQAKPPSDSWLLDADTDHDRFRRLEVVLRGANIHMLEIGLRFESMHGALARANFPLAGYESQRIVQSASIALLKQPGFAAGGGLDYLGRAEWSALQAAIVAHDGESARARFLEVRQACMSCHATEKLGYLNDSDVFDRTAAFAPAEAAAVRRQP
jgi:hypothetical protein